jgi:drug/metabolite transporter (DMT)-like permease
MSQSLRERLAGLGGLSSLLSSRAIAALQALFVTFLWSTSYVLVKVGLAEIPALTFAGLRYGLAWCCLVPLALRGETRRELAGISRRGWAALAVLGVVYYAVTQGAQFVALQYLPAVTVSLFLNFTPVLVAAGGAVLLAERPTGAQWVGVALSVGGAIVYFVPVALPASRAFGLAVMALGLLANAGSSVLGRHANRGDSYSPLAVTVVSMGIGSALLLGSAWWPRASRRCRSSRGPSSSGWRSSTPRSRSRSGTTRSRRCRRWSSRSSTTPCSSRSPSSGGCSSGRR